MGDWAMSSKWFKANGYWAILAIMVAAGVCRYLLELSR